jgi:plasmid maintenance system antidote protein VapI
MAHKKLSDEIRDVLAASGMSRHAIAKALGIAESTLSRFVNGKGGLSMEYLARLGELLGLHVVVRPSKKDRGK